MDTNITLIKSHARKLELKNPILNASGTFGYGDEFSEIFDLSILGGIVTKGISLMPKQGNPVPRIVETACGLINAIGLENIGVDAFLAEKLTFLRKFNTPVIVNFFGNTEEEYINCAKKLSVKGIDALEMNVSCPNVKKGGIQFGTDPKILSSLVKKIRDVTEKPLIIKLSPLVSDIAKMACASQDAGADAITCINTIPAMAIDEQTRKPILGNVTGGLSGPAIKPIALRMVWEVSKKCSIPVIGSGGICSAADVIQFMLAGASAVEIGSYSLREPFCFPEIINGLELYMKQHKIAAIRDIIGKLKI
jgi:dihydroorotate dehydrogenase (NAD+) catalytic subunit